MKRAVITTLFTAILSMAFVGCKDKDDPSVIKSIACEEDEIQLNLFESAEVTISIEPENADDKSYEWEISDPTIAKAEGNVITGLKEGETWAKIFSIPRPELKDSIKITVAATNISFNADNMSFGGRLDISENNATLFYPGSYISTEFTGTSICADLSATKDVYYWVQVDDQEPYKLNVRSKANWVSGNSSRSIFWLAKNLEPGTHKATITLVSEGIYKLPKFYGFVIDKNAVLTKPETKSLKFEFIGNSITCGYGTEVTDRSAFQDSTSNFCHTFAYHTAEAFNADYMVVARSGMGMYRNYGNKDFPTMLETYEKLWLGNSANWDFSKYTADVVFINLGTNDTWEMSSFSAEEYESAYRSLLDKILSHYPNAKLVLLTGCMVQNDALSSLKTVLNKIQSDYNTTTHPCYRFDFKTVAGTGADWHPCAAQQEKMGKDLVEFLQQEVLK